MRQRAFAGLRRYQSAPRPADADPPHIVARTGRASLLSRHRDSLPHDNSSTQRAPVLLIPSLINPPGVLDISEQRSLLRFLLREGHDTYLLDWGTPGSADSQSDFADHIETLLLPLIARFARPPILIGYCLGGTLALGAAARMAARGQAASAVATIAAPWDFAQYAAAFRAQIASIWAQNEAICAQLGLVPMEILQTGFWSLDPQRTIAKYAAFADLEDDSPAFDGFITLEDWANAGAPLTLASGRDLVTGCYGENHPGEGKWQVSGTTVDPTALACPTLAIASRRDAIVPAATTPPADRRIDLDLGHVGMMIGSRAEEALWQPLSAWLSSQQGRC